MSGLRDVLGAVAAGEWDAAAVAAAEVAARDPDSRLAAALHTFLSAQRTPGVYDEPSAFEAFIDHGANPELYRRTIQRLATLHAEHRPVTVMDVGCGDGRVTAATVGAWTTRADLVEPSAALLAEAETAVAETGVHAVARNSGVVDFLTNEPDVEWDLVQSTFALHTLTPAERPFVFDQLAERASFLAIVEFDVPEFREGSPEQLAYLADRYELGVREYEAHPEVIAGFLMPVLVGQLDPATPRYTYEQPIVAWAAALESAGFTVSTTPVFDYWWAPAVLLTATPAR